MKLIIQREDFLKPLQLVLGAIENRQTLPILSNVMLSLNNKKLSIAATDLEIELTAYTMIEDNNLIEPDQITVNARKLLDICRMLPNNSKIELNTEKELLIVRSGRSRFNLLTLPVDKFPKVEEEVKKLEFSLPQNILKSLIEKTHYAIAHQDIRHFLNGMLFDINQGVIRTIATDGHRLSFGFSSDLDIKDRELQLQIIVPRKGVMELIRLLEDNDDEIKISISANHIHIDAKNFNFISKLIDSKYPDYNRVVKKESNETVIVDRNNLKQALTRVAILTNEKGRGVRLLLNDNLLKIFANNSEQEEAEEEVEVNYGGPELEIGFNVSYLIEACSYIISDEIAIKTVVFGQNTGFLIDEQIANSNYTHVVMPMKL